MRSTIVFYADGDLWFRLDKIVNVPRTGDAVSFGGVDRVVTLVNYVYEPMATKARPNDVAQLIEIRVHT